MRKREKHGRFLGYYAYTSVARTFILKSLRRRPSNNHTPWSGPSSSVPSSHTPTHRFFPHRTSPFDGPFPRVQNAERRDGPYLSNDVRPPLAMVIPAHGDMTEMERKTGTRPLSEGDIDDRSF